MAADLVAERQVILQRSPVITHTAQLIWEQVRVHRNLTLRSRVQDLLAQLQSAAVPTHQTEVLDGLDRALRSDQGDALIVARAHLSALRGVIEDDDLLSP